MYIRVCNGESVCVGVCVFMYVCRIKWGKLEQGLYCLRCPAILATAERPVRGGNK